MSQTKAHPENEPGKHGDHPKAAINTEQTEAIPPAEDGSHPRSPAAHLEVKGKADTKPAGNLRQGSHPGALREPPTVVQKAGKQHK